MCVPVVSRILRWKLSTRDNMAAGNDRLAVEKLNGSENWSTWKFQIKHMLLAKDLWKYADGSEVLAVGANEATTAQFNSNSQKALTQIVLSINTSQLYLITSCTTAAGAWKELCGHFECNTLGNKLILKKEYFRMEMKEGTEMEFHLKRMKELTERLAAIDSAISEEDQIVTLLGSLPRSYEHIVTALEARASTDLKLSYVQQTLLYEEKKRTGNPPVADGSSALLSQDRKKSKNFKCYKCGEIGHFRSECPKNKSEKGQRQKHRAKTANEKTSDLDETLFKASTGIQQNQKWIIDSGASSHMVTERNAMTTLTALDPPEKVCLGDGYTVDAIGRGKVNLTCVAEGNVNSLVLSDVLLVPDLHCNLFSVRSAAAHGKRIEFDGSDCVIKDSKGKTWAKGNLDGKLYTLDCKTEHHASVAETKSDLWHKRLGHINEQRMQELAKKKLVTGVSLDTSQVQFCEPCVKGKMSRKKFDNAKEKRTTRKLERIHSDVCGPMQTESHGGKRYFVTFIDDYSKCCAVYFIRNKSEVLEKFQEFEAAVTVETGLKIGALRSDNGGEYVSEAFGNFLKSKGIQHELTVPDTPQQNGTAERMNRTLVESARAMLFNSGLPMVFWAEAISTACYLRNRTQTAGIKEATPYEVWYGRKPDLSHLRIFGCAAYALVRDFQRKKWDSKAQKMIFIGYSRSAKGFRLYDPTSRRVFVRKDVIFNESDLGKNAKEESAQKQRPPVVEIDLGDKDSEAQKEELQANPRAQRQRRPPIRYGYEEYADAAHFALNVSSLKEALESEDGAKWKAAADVEYSSLIENHTWDLVEPPENAKVIESRWVFKVKNDCNGNVERYKARLVAKGYSQVKGIDYNETFSPVVRFLTVRALLASGVQQKKLIHQMDVTTAFLNGKLEEDVYMYQPEGYVKAGKERLVCKLNKSLYGLKQAPRCWNKELNIFLSDIGYSQSAADPCVYLKDGNIIAIYVDDLIVMTDSEDEMISIKRSLADKFKMKDLGEINFFLGVTVQRNGDDLVLHQKSYIEEILRKYKMQDSKPVSTPRDMNVQLEKEDGSESVDQTLYQSIVGALLYVSMATRPDIAQAVGAVSRYSADPKQTHLTAAKRILRYLKGTTELVLTYRCVDGNLCCFSDSDWAGDVDTRHSTSGYILTLGGCAISWNSKLQRVTALSTAEAEFIAVSEACKELMWMKKLMEEVQNVKLPMTVMEDNQAAIAMIKNPVYHARTKHIDIRYHFIRELYQEGQIRLEYCPSSENIADLMTKPIPRVQFGKLCERLGLIVA